MREIKNILGLVAAILIFHASGCKSKEAMSEEKIQLARLAREWKPANDQFVTLDDIDASAYFKNFTLAIDNNKSFATTNGNSPVWPAAGIFEFEKSKGTTNFNRLVRSDGMVINIVELSENTLRLEFFYDHSGSGGRTTAVSGQYSFLLNAQK